MKAICLSLAAGLALTGCNQAPRAEAPAKVDTAAVERELKNNEAQWEKDYAAKDVDKLAGHYAEEAALANPGMALAVDDVARKLLITQFVADPNLKISFGSDRIGVAQSGELAYTRGHYTMTFTDTATKQPKTETGSYLTVYRKQSDGSWKAIEDFITPGAPAAQ